MSSSVGPSDAEVLRSMKSLTAIIIFSLAVMDLFVLGRLLVPFVADRFGFGSYVPNFPVYGTYLGLVLAGASSLALVFVFSPGYRKLLSRDEYGLPARMAVAVVALFVCCSFIATASLFTGSI